MLIRVTLTFCTLFVCFFDFVLFVSGLAFIVLTFVLVTGVGSIYNDFAEAAIKVFRQQHLFEEIEAGVNLVFDQLIFAYVKHLIIIKIRITNITTKCV